MSQPRWDDFLETIRRLLIEADSMLSAYGHGRAITKAEALELSGRCRTFYEKRMPPPRPQEPSR